VAARDLKEGRKHRPTSPKKKREIREMMMRESPKLVDIVERQTERRKGGCHSDKLEEGQASR